MSDTLLFHDLRGCLEIGNPEYNHRSFRTVLNGPIGVENINALFGQLAGKLSERSGPVRKMRGQNVLLLVSISQLLQDFLSDIGGTGYDPDSRSSGLVGNLNGADVHSHFGQFTAKPRQSSL